MRVTSPPAPRLAYLDALRGVACLLVLVYHGAIRVSPAFRLLDPYIHLGHMGVVVFFLISGSIIPQSLERGGQRVFWWRRVWRLFPVYWLSLLLVVLCAASGLIRPDTDWLVVPTPASLLANLVMLQTFLGYPHLNEVHWSLTVELVFYAVASMAYALRLHRFPVALALACVLASPLDRLLVLPLFGYLAVLWTGTALAQVRGGRVSWPPVLLLVLAVGLQGLVAPSLPFVYATARLAGLAVGAAVLLGAPRRVPTALVSVGRWSYAIYVLHPFVLLYVPAVGASWLALSVWIGLTMAISAGVYRWVERPGMALGRSGPGAATGRDERPATRPSAALPAPVGR